jgi:hypothetical protein
MCDWLALPPGSDGASWQLDSRWSWAPWATLLLISFAIAWTIAIYRREQSQAGWAMRSVLVALRLTAVATLLVMLAQWAIAVRLTGPPAIALVIDRSASMAIVDRYDEPEIAAKIASQLRKSENADVSRFELLKSILALGEGAFVEELPKRYRPSIYLVADDVDRVAASEYHGKLQQLGDALSTGGPEQNATRLGDAIRRVLSDYRGQLLQCLRQIARAILRLLEQPHVLNSDHRLVGEGLD